MRTNSQQQPADEYSRTGRRDERTVRLRRSVSSPPSSPAPAGARCDRPRVLPLHRTRACGGPTTAGLNWHPHRLGRRRADVARLCRGGAPLPFEPVQPRREPDRPEPHRGRAPPAGSSTSPPNGGATWTDIDLIAKVPGYQGFVTNVTWQDNQNDVDHLGGAGAGGRARHQGARSRVPAIAGRAPRSRPCRTASRTCR